MDGVTILVVCVALAAGFALGYAWGARERWR